MELISRQIHSSALYPLPYSDAIDSPLGYSLENTSFSEACSDILSVLGHEIRNLFKEALKAVKIYNRVTKLFLPDQYKCDVEQLNFQVNDLFNEQFNKQLATQFKENLVSISSDPAVDKNEELIANIYNRTQLISVLEQIQKDEVNEVVSNPIHVLPELTMMIGLLKANQAEYLSIKEKAKISLSFDKIANSYEAALAKGVLSHRQQQTAAIVSDLQFACFMQYVQAAHEKLTFDFAQKFEHKWKLGHLRSTSYQGSIGVATPYSALGNAASASLSGSRDYMQFTDPEGYLNEYKLTYGGITAEYEASLGGEMPEISKSKATFRANGSVHGMYGSFREPKTPKDLAVRDFHALVEKHRTSNMVAPYLSRAKLLATSAGKECGIDTELIDTLNELEDIEPLIRSLNARKSAIDKRLFRYMESSLPEEPPTAFATAPVKVMTSEITQARIWGAVGKFFVGGEVKLGVGPELDKNAELDKGVNSVVGPSMTPSIGPNFNITLHGSGETMLRFRDEVKRTPVCLRWMDPTKSNDEKARIKQHSAEQFEVFRNKLMSSWRKDPVVFERGFSDLGLAVLERAKNYDVVGQSKAQSKDDFLNFLKLNDLDLALVRLLEKNDAQRQLYIYKFPRLINKNNDARNPLPLETNLWTQFLRLERDFKKYTKLQNSEVGICRDFKNTKQKQEALTAFENRYGASRPEELIHRMHIVSRYLLTHADGLEKDFANDPNHDEFNEAILKFEKTLLEPLFAVDKEYLEDRLNFVEDLRITLFETQFEAGSKGAASLEMNSGVKNAVDNDEVPVKSEFSTNLYAQFKVRFKYTHLSGHLNKWRRGHGLQISFTFATGIDVKGVITALKPVFGEHLPADFAPHALAELQEKLIGETAAAGSYATEKSFDFYIGKPDKFSEDSKGFEFSHFYSRRTKSEMKELAVKKAIPLGTVDLTVGGGYKTVKTDATEEICGSESLIQFFILGTHQYQVGKVSKTTGLPVEGLEVDEATQAAYQQFFINFANEPHFEDDKRPEGHISREIVEIENAVNQHNYLKQLLFIFQNERRAATDAETIDFLTGKIKAINAAIEDGQLSNDLNGALEEFNFRNARNNFKQAALHFKQAALNFKANPKNKSAYKKAYQKALACFNQLMFIDFAQWLDFRSNSKDLKPREELPIDTQVTVEERIQLAKASLAGIMLQYGMA